MSRDHQAQFDFLGIEKHPGLRPRAGRERLLRAIYSHPSKEQRFWIERLFTVA
jgi:hypothetical protein